MNNIKKRTWFTLVELIVVVTILAVLATIGFVSYSSYLVWVRDTNRYAQLVSIHDGLQLYSTRSDLPRPDDGVDVKVESQPIAIQWKAWANVLETIDFSKWWIDPKDGNYFSYYLLNNWRDFQLMAYLEGAPESIWLTSSIVTNSYAVNYEDRTPIVIWRKLWILVSDTTNWPIEDDPSVSWNWEIDITNSNASTIGVTAILSDDEFAEDWELITLSPNSSCKRIKQLKWGSPSWKYTINPTGTNEIEVFCEMETDGGWWTFIMFFDWDTTPSTSMPKYFEWPVWNYSTQRANTWSPYSILDLADLYDTEMMITAEFIDPIEAYKEKKLIFYKHPVVNTGFTTWPLPCATMGYDYSWRLSMSWDYINTPTSTSTCWTTYWYPKIGTSSTNDWFIWLSTSQWTTIWYSMGWSLEHWLDSWWYVR